MFIDLAIQKCFQAPAGRHVSFNGLEQVTLVIHAAPTELDLLFRRMGYKH